MLLEYLFDKEPVTLDEVRHQCKADTADDDFLRDVIIPAARSVAEDRTGSAIRPARYQADFYGESKLVLPVSSVIEIESVKAGDIDLHYSVALRRRHTIITLGHALPATVVFTAGIEDIEKYPGVKAWILLACGWLYENRDLVTAGAIPAVPTFADSLLSSINVPACF